VEHDDDTSILLAAAKVAFAKTLNVSVDSVTATAMNKNNQRSLFTVGFPMLFTHFTPHKHVAKSASNKLLHPNFESTLLSFIKKHLNESGSSITLYATKVHQIIPHKLNVHESATITTKTASIPTDVATIITDTDTITTETTFTIQRTPNVKYEDMNEETRTHFPPFFSI